MRPILFIALFSWACQSAPEPPVRVVTYNIAAGNGDLEEVARAIAALEADVVALQEVDVRWGERSGFADQARILAEMLGMAYFFAPIYSLSARDEDALPGSGQAVSSDTVPPREFGLAVLTKHPIVRQENHLLTRLSTQSADTTLRRMPGFAEVVVDLRGRRVRLFNTHLDYRPDPSVRSWQVEEMLEIIGEEDGPALLLGDLNARPEAPEVAPLFRQFADAWGRGDGPGFTYPAGEPDRRIDYVLHTRHFSAERAWVPVTEASDHRPVVADLLW